MGEKEAAAREGKEGQQVTFDRLYKLAWLILAAALVYLVIERGLTLYINPGGALDVIRK